MIDPQVFEQEIAILLDWYNRDFEPATLKRLHQRLSQHLSTEQFVRAAQAVFDTSRFFLLPGATRKSERWRVGRKLEAYLS